MAEKKNIYSTTREFSLFASKGNFFVCFVHKNATQKALFYVTIKFNTKARTTLFPSVNLPKTKEEKVELNFLLDDTKMLQTKKYVFFSNYRRPNEKLNYKKREI